MNQLLTCEDIAKIIGRTPRTIQRWARDRTVPHIRIGRTIRFTQDQVDEILAAYSVEPTTPVHADTLNPGYHPHAVIVPMRRLA